MKKKTYIVVGSNNFWYAQFTVKPEVLPECIEEIIEKIKDGDYQDDKKPETLRAYEVGDDRTFRAFPTGVNY